MMKESEHQKDVTITNAGAPTVRVPNIWEKHTY